MKVKKKPKRNDIEVVLFKVAERPSLVLGDKEAIGGVVGEYTDTGRKTRMSHFLKVFFPDKKEAPQKIKIKYSLLEVEV